ncbi:hypothetical protein INR49_015819 [Caranx melampygus]|nr:hypothetical protein INR49_015819 [Caranx melampygus]
MEILIPVSVAPTVSIRNHLQLSQVIDQTDPLQTTALFSHYELVLLRHHGNPASTPCPSPM